MTELTDQIKVVVEARQEAQEASEAKKIALSQWEKENWELLTALTDSQEMLAEKETKLRDLTLKAYAETGNKAPAPGVGIREVTKYAYNSKDAFGWAIKHELALELDKKAFEKMVKASPMAFDFVAETQEPQATISANLAVAES